MATYTDLEAETGIPRNKLRWSCNDLKERKRLDQTEDGATNEIAFRITGLGIQHLADNAPPNINVSTPAGSGDVTPAAAHRKTRVAGGTKRTEPPTEGAAPVIEAAKRDETPVAPASDKALEENTQPTPPRIITNQAHAMLCGPEYFDILERIAKVTVFPEGEKFTNLPGHVADLVARALSLENGKTIHIHRCPFCGHDDVEISELGHDEFAITCPECRVIGPTQASTMDAISFWNDRRGA